MDLQLCLLRLKQMLGFCVCHCFAWNYTVGAGAVIVDAGAVMTKDIVPWTVIGSNPAKFIKKCVLREIPE